MATTATEPTADRDERVRRVGGLRKLLDRPELGAIAGLIVVWVFFAIIAAENNFVGMATTASILNRAAPLGILAVAVALLMIAGEFDLSIGSILGFSGMAIMIAVTPVDAGGLGWSLLPAVILALVLALVTGLVNGWLVVVTKLPSFIITLGTLFTFRGLTIAITRARTNRTQLGNLDEVPGFEFFRSYFGREFELLGAHFSISILWWIAFTALATWILVRTRAGNWIFGTGGAPEAARAVGVPVTSREDRAVPHDRLRGVLRGDVPGGGVHGRRHAPRHPPRVRGDHRGGRGRLPPDRRLRIRGRRGARGADLRDGAAGDRDHGDRRRLVPGLHRRGAPRRRDLQQLHPEEGGQPMTEDNDALIETRHLSKYFGSVIAIKDISMLVHPGKVTCLLGDNGAGKSTLIKTLSGVYEPSEGDYLCDGEEMHLKSPRDALARGIATVYQDLAMIPLLSIWRNFFLGSEPTKGWGPFRRFDTKKAKEITREELSKMGIDIRDPEQAVGTLSGGERQSLAIARAVYFGARVLILDEPTAALGVKQAGVVLRYIVTAKQRGVAVVFITHNPHHAYPVGDHFVILRRGKVFGSFPKADLTLEHLVQMMAGGAELETLAHELQEVAGDDPDLRQAVAELAQEVKTAPTVPGAAEPPSQAVTDGEAGAED